MYSSRKRTQLSSISLCAGLILKTVSNATPKALHATHTRPLCPDLDSADPSLSTVYDLVANVTHESAAGTTRDKESTVWKVHLRAGSGGGENEKWFQIQDLIVEEIRKEMIFLGETIIQVSRDCAFALWVFIPLTDMGASGFLAVTNCLRYST